MAAAEREQPMVLMWVSDASWAGLRAPAGSCPERGGRGVSWGRSCGSTHSLGKGGPLQNPHPPGHPVSRTPSYNPVPPHTPCTPTHSLYPHAYLHPHLQGGGIRMEGRGKEEDGRREGGWRVGEDGSREGRRREEGSRKEGNREGGGRKEEEGTRKREGGNKGRRKRGGRMKERGKEGGSRKGERRKEHGNRRKKEGGKVEEGRRKGIVDQQDGEVGEVVAVADNGALPVHGLAALHAPAARARAYRRAAVRGWHSSQGMGTVEPCQGCPGGRRAMPSGWHRAGITSALAVATLTGAGLPEDADGIGGILMEWGQRGRAGDPP